MKVSGSSYIFLVLYVINIMLLSNDSDLLTETNYFLFSHVDMKAVKPCIFLVFKFFVIRPIVC